MDNIGCIDYEGQQRVHLIVHYGLIAAALLSFVIGFLLQNAWLSVWIFIALSIAIMGAAVPPWPYLKRDMDKYVWVPSRYQAALKNLQAQLDGEQSPAVVSITIK